MTTPLHDTHVSRFRLGPAWQPVDISAALTGHGDLAPTVLTRDDGPALFYDSKVHSISGEPESLKTWLILVAAAQLLNKGERVVWLDFEDSATSVVGRLKALGCTAAAIVKSFSYVRPTDPLPTGVEIHADGLTSRPVPPSLVVIDGVTEAMALHGLEPNSNSDVAAFANLLAKPLARGAYPSELTGPAVVLIDHLVKNREQRSRFAIGAQHKLAGLDGAAYLIDLKQPFGHGKHGIARLDVAKDRPGRVREHAAGNHIADLHLRSEADGSVLAELHAPDATSPTGTFRPTVLMERVSQFLEASVEPRSLRDVQSGVKGNTAAKRAALNCLVDEGHVARDTDGGAHLHRSTRPFRQDPQT